MSKLHIELQRVQSWLFAVPRLRTMVGANVLLGETLRVDLPKLARNAGSWELAPAAGGYPTADPDDPLKEEDDPAADAAAGILARDGGHFEARFAKGASAFARAAARLLEEKLPGLPFRIRIDGKDQMARSRVHLATELPVLAPCAWTGQGLASEIVTQGTERAAVSLAVKRRHEAAKRAETTDAKDLANLLSATTKLGNLDRPQEFKDLVGSGYLALIHADGNGIGAAAKECGDQEERARFFHRNRVFLRRALQKAIDRVCPDTAGPAPLVLLMLGGDDLLVVSRAEVALPFVVRLCEELAALQTKKDSFRPLTLGVGVVIAKHTIPIHRLHEVAGRLADSAKRRFRGLAEKRRSVVDWAVYTTAWLDDPEEVRRRDWLCGRAEELRVLSQRPIDVLGQGLNTLQGLIQGAEKLKEAPRSQLRYLVEQLPRGRVLSKLAFFELTDKARRALEGAGLTESTLWQSRQEESERRSWLTPLLDLVEIAEIGRLGRDRAAAQPAGEARDG